MLRFFQWYFGSFILSCIVLIGMLFYFGLSFSEVKTHSFDYFLQFTAQWRFWVLLLIPYIIYQLVSYFSNAYNVHGKTAYWRRATFSIILPFGLFLSLFDFSPLVSTIDSYNSVIENNKSMSSFLSDHDEMHRGGHVFGRIDSTNIQPFVLNNFEWITIVPYGDQKDYDSPSMSYYLEDSLKMIRRDSIWTSQIDVAHAAGLKVFIKPHIWLYAPTGGKWRSDIYPKNDENWELWKRNYREFILRFAKLAEKNNAEMLCVGTEFSRLSTKKSEFWVSLIHEVRSIYSGKLTYAANWYKEFEEITFWEELDYIGIQAYFPLVKNDYPSVEQISKGWKKHLPAIESIHKKYNKKVLFTELGYKSTADSAIEPWLWIEYSSEENRPISIETQANCYEAFFRTVWGQDWFAGVHIWQLSTRFKKGRGRSDYDFTPQGKPAEQIIASGFEKEEGKSGK